MTVTRENVEFTKRIFRDRLGDSYVYGGNWSPTNPRVGTDCSGLVGDCLDGVNLGPSMPWRRSVSTESWGFDYARNRPVAPGTRGPKGTIAVASLRDIPSDAAVIVNIHHGGGGESSHTQCIVDGVLMESNGSHGTCTRDARGAGGGMDPNSSYWTDHWYLPGPIDGVAPPAPPSTEDLQRKLNTEGAGLEVDGDYGPKTAQAVSDWDRRTKYAGLTLAEGQRRKISPRGIQISFTVPFVESRWKMYANDNVPESMSIPHDAVGEDYDSVGLWQQRCPMWGPAHVLMDPTLSAGLFYDHLEKTDYNNLGIRPGDIAADIQRPAAQYRGRYQDEWDHAVNLYNRLTTTDQLDEWDRLMADATRYPSRAWSRGDDTANFTAIDLLRNLDGMKYDEKIEQDAYRGDLNAISILARLAQGQGPEGKNLAAVAWAQRIIRTVQSAVANQNGSK